MDSGRGGMKLKYMKAYGFYQCENCRKPYAASYIEHCREHQYAPDVNFCLHCGIRWDVVDFPEKGVAK